MEQSKGFDAASLVLGDDAITVIEILDRAKKPTGILITVTSKESELYRKTVRKQQNRRLRGLRRSQGVTLTAEENENEALELLVVSTKGWCGMQWHGQDVEFSKEMCMEIYGEVQIIRDQVEDAIADASLFQ